MKLLILKSYLEQYLDSCENLEQFEDERDAEDAELIKETVQAVLENISTGHSRFNYGDKVSFSGMEFTVIGYFSTAETPIGVVCANVNGAPWFLADGELKQCSTL